MSTSQTDGATIAPTNGVKRVPPLQVIVSLSTLACWIMLYGAGLLMESIEERIVLAPHTMEKQLGEKPNRSVTSKSEKGQKIDQKGEKTESFVDKVLAKKDEWSMPRSFFVALLIYTPTNMALLTLFAGCLGGCVSNIKYSMMEKEEREKLTKEESSILCENPLSATLRGFVIYLCLIAGLYAAVDDPFKDSTPGQYARLAGSLSLVAFIVGFDPSRIKAWLKMADQKETKTTP